VEEKRDESDKEAAWWSRVDRAVRATRTILTVSSWENVATNLIGVVIFSAVVAAGVGFVVLLWKMRNLFLGAL
jgi:hypothetical protein